MHRDGYGILLALVVAALVLTFGYRLLGGGIALRLLSLVLWISAAFTLFFFRDPEREIPSGEGLVLSPADGTVIGIDEVDEPEFVKARTRRVSIFLSPFNVHVNRVPCDGEVKYFRYQTGRFRVASQPAASTENEQTIIGLETPEGRILFKQIAGIFKFGSRMEIFLPLTAEVKVRLREKVKAGESIIGELEHDT
jgi:phosphatidylserine decarboxylase